MSRTVRILIIVGVVLAVIAGAIAVYFFYANTPEPEPTANINQAVNDVTAPVNDTVVVPDTPTPDTNGETTPTTPTEVAATEDDEGETILRLARIFVERYGTFSNRNNFENITDLEPFMTESLRQESAEFISSNQGVGIPDNYYGITTHVQSLELIELKEGESAQVRVATQRIESEGTTDPKVSSQSAIVNFKSVEGDWKVNSISFK